MRDLIFCVVVILIILLIVLTSGRTSVERLENPVIPLSTSDQPDTDYCPYRALLGIWRTTASNSTPAFRKEYEFVTLPDAKTVLLVARHIISNPDGYGAPTTFTRGACVLSNFKCQSGFAGDVSIEARCVSNTPSYFAAPLNELPSKFKVIVNSKETLIIDESGDEYHKI